MDLWTLCDDVGWLVGWLVDIVTVHNKYHSDSIQFNSIQIPR